MGTATMEKSMESPQKPKTEHYHMILQFHSWAYIWRKRLI